MNVGVYGSSSATTAPPKKTTRKTNIKKALELSLQILQHAEQEKSKQPEPAQDEKFDEAVVSQLVEMGFTQEQVKQALRICNHDADAAALHLFEGMN